MTSKETVQKIISHNRPSFAAHQLYVLLHEAESALVKEGYTYHPIDVIKWRKEKRP